MTTPIMNALDIAQQPPYMLGWQELDRFQRDIAAIYEQKPKEDRKALLTDDCLSLILRHRMAAGNPLFERNEKIQGCIEDVARLLLHVADSLNTRLPDSIIEQCRNSTEESASRFYEIIAEAYITPAWKAQKKADSDTKGEGMGSNATTNPQTPPASKKMPKTDVWDSGKPKEILEEAVKSGLAEKKDDGYYWIEGSQITGWQIGLYGYFVKNVCERMGWKSKKAQRLEWLKFKSAFKNHNRLLPQARQTVTKGEVPSLYYKVDELIKNVFDVDTTFKHKPF